MNILEEYDDGEDLVASHLYAGNSRIATIIPNNDIYYVCSDQIMSSKTLVDGSGNKDQTRDYHPFGNTRTATGAVSDYQFSGKERDETGLYYFGKRYYDPNIVRWLSVDPMADKYPSLSPYVYCAGNPLRYVDPSGEMVSSTDSSNWAQAALEINAIYYMKFGQSASVTVVPGKPIVNVNLLKTIGASLAAGRYTPVYDVKKTWQLSTDNSKFNWGTGEFTSALYDCINTDQIDFRISFQTCKGGGGFVRGHGDWADIIVDPKGYSNPRLGGIIEESGLLLLHEVTGHGHPFIATVSGTDSPYPWYPGNVSKVNEYYKGTEPRLIEGGYRGGTWPNRLNWSRTNLFIKK